MNSAYAVGATFTLENLFSPEVKKIAEDLRVLSGQVDKTRKDLTGIVPAKSIAARIEEVCGSFDLLGKDADAATKALVTAMDRAVGGVAKASTSIKGELDGTFAGADAKANAAADAIVGAMGRAATGVAADADTMREAFAGAFVDFGAGLDGSVNSITVQLGRITTSAGEAARSIAAIRTELTSLATIKDLGLPTLPGAGGGANLGHRRGSHGGLHMRGPSAHLPGGAHVSGSGDGMVPLIGGFALSELVKTGVEHGFDMSHWESQYAAAGFGSADIERAKKAAWNNASLNPNASATDSLKNILELNKATGNLDESIGLLPAFSTAEMAMQSIKAEGLHSKFNGGNQILNFAKGLEEMGITQRGGTEEERAANTKHYANELLRTMISSRGLFDGNALFAMTNNSGGAAQNWDERMGTVVAPILGDIMKHSKLGNADYMALKSYVGGGITSKAVVGLLKYGLAKESDTYTDSKGIHLSANAPWSDGASENLLDWSGKLLERMQAHGVNIHDQKEVNKVVNEIGSNKSTTMMMRALLEPGTRAQIVKEMALRDAVPDNAASVLQNKDPVLKLDALHKATDNFFTALGGPLVDPAIAGLTKLTSAINAMSAAMVAHPDLTRYGAEAAGVAGIGLLGYGGGKMLGLFGGADAGLKQAAVNLDAAAAHLMGAPGGVPGVSPGGGVPGKKSPGAAVAEGTISGFLYQYGVGAMDRFLGWTPENQKTLDHATSLSGVIQDVRKEWFGGSAVPLPPLRPGATYDAPNTDGNALHRNDEMPAAKAGEKLGMLSDKTGFVLTSFDGLKADGAKLGGQFVDLSTGSASLDGVFKILEATGLGAARALAMVAMSGGGAGGAGGGIINASFGGGGGIGGGGNPALGGGSFGGSIGNGTAIDRAMGMVGLREGQAAHALNHIMHAGEWCADFVNGTIAASGGKGSGSAMARSFMGWGHGVGLGDIQKGDVAVLNHGGHVGFFTGERRADGRLGVVAGNTRDGRGGHDVEHYFVSPNSVFGARRGAADIRPQAPGVTAGVRAAPAQPIHIKLDSAMNVDGKKMAGVVSYHQAKGMRYPTGLGLDSHSHFTNPGTNVPDSA